MILTRLASFDEVLGLIFDILSNLFSMLDDTTFVGGFSILDFLLASFILTVIFAIFINSVKVTNID